MVLKTPIAYPPIAGSSHLPLSPPQTPNPGTSLASQPAQQSVDGPPTPTSASSSVVTNGDKPTGPHQESIQQLIEHFGKEGYKIGVKELSVDEQMYLSAEGLLRCLTAEKFKVAPTIQRLEGTVAWRREMQLDDVEAVAKEIEPEMQCGKIFTFSYAANGSPLIYMTPSKNDTEPSPRQVKNTMFVIDRAVDLMVDGVSEVAMILDLGGTIKRSSGALGVMRGILSAAQAHYPDRLSWCVARQIPWMSKLLVNIMWPFIDPYTRSKLHFDVPVEAEGRVDPAHLPKQSGGTLDFEYDASEYLPELVRICLERRRSNRARFLDAKGEVGTSEHVWRWRPSMSHDGAS